MTCIDFLSPGVEHDKDMELLFLNQKPYNDGGGPSESNP